MENDGTHAGEIHIPSTISLSPTREQIAEAIQRGVIVEDVTPYRICTAACSSPQEPNPKPTSLSIPMTRQQRIEFLQSDKRRAQEELRKLRAAHEASQTQDFPEP